MAQHIHSGATVGGVVTQVIFNTWYRSIEISNRSSGDMWVRLDGVDPTIAGDDCIFVAGLGFTSEDNPKVPPSPALGTTSNCEIRIITAATANFTIAVGV
jgi:hypothetical protein